MANPNLKVVRRRLTGAAGAPSDMEAGQIAINSVDEKVYIHNGTSAIPVAGKGEFVDKGSEQSVTGKKNFTSATVSTAPSALTDVVRKTDLDTEVTALQGAITTEAGTRAAADTALGLRIDALGSAFNYVGTVNGGANSGAATNLASLTQKDAGDYYKVGTAGHFVLAPAASFFANSGDGLVFNLANGIDKLDNTDSTVAGTANEISVTGSTDTGYTVAIDAVFSGRMTTAESDIDALEGRVTTAESDIDALEGRATTAESDIDALEGRMTTAESDIDALEGRMTTAESDIDALEGRADDLESKTQNIDLAGTVAGTTVLNGALEIGGAVEVTGNLVGTGTNQITDFVIDAGTF
jgi:hypothetical protein